MGGVGEVEDLAAGELRADGTVESRQGSGTVVRSSFARTVAGSRVVDTFSASPGIDLSAGNAPDPAHLPPVHLDVAALLSGGAGPGLEPLGLPALREALAARHSQQGRMTDPAQIHVTAGAHQAIGLAIGALTGPGTAVAVEDISYPGVFDILDGLGARPVAVGCDEHGMRPDHLEQVLATHQPPVLYIQSGPHNPTGRVTTRDRRHALAAVCDRHDVIVVEDGALADLACPDIVRPDLARLCHRALVISVGSFSKVAWGGLRIGWLRAPAPFVERTMYLRLAGDLGPSVPAQLLSLQLLTTYDHLAAHRRASLAATIQDVRHRLMTDMPSWHVSDPAGGSLLWAELPIDDTNPYVALARRHGVHVAPGSSAVPSRTATSHVRLCLDRPWPTIEEGIRRLSLAWRELTTAPNTVLG